jgi:hypothetical protein
VTSVRLLELVPAVMRSSPGLPSGSHSGLAAHPVHSMGSRSLPRPRFAHTMRSGAGLSHLLSIAYDYDVLGLGPDSPWGDWRCPGTLRRPVWMVLTSITLLIPAFALVRAPPVLAVWLLRRTQRSPTMSPSLSLSLSPPRSRESVTGRQTDTVEHPQLRYDA